MEKTCGSGSENEELSIAPHERKELDIHHIMDYDSSFGIQAIVIRLYYFGRGGNRESCSGGMA